MDPNAAYDEMIQAERDCDWQAVFERAENLLAWVDNGGFEPNRPNWLAFTANAVERANLHSRGRTVAELNGMGTA